MANSSLTGSWSGAYRYPGGGQEVVFNAQIEETGAAFGGAIQEPNVLHPDFGPVVTASCDGVRSGDAVTFTKHYDGSGGMDHDVRYAGRVNAALTRIEGRWILPGVWSGDFFMNRDDDGAEAQAEAMARAEIGGGK